MDLFCHVICVLTYLPTANLTDPGSGELSKLAETMEPDVNALHSSEQSTVHNSLNVNNDMIQNYLWQFRKIIDIYKTK